MGICIQVRKKIIFVTGRENTYITMGAITMEIGTRAKCRDRVSCITAMEISSTKGNGKMMNTKAKELCMDWGM